MSSIPYRSSVPQAVGENRGRIKILEAVPGGESEPSYAYLFSYTTPESVPAGGSLRLANEKFWTNSPNTVFSSGTATVPNVNGTGDLYLHFHAAGIYFVYADVFWENGSGVYARTTWVDTTCVQFNQNELTAGGAFNTQDAGNSDPLQDRSILYNLVDQYTLTNSPTYRHRVSTLVFNEDASAQDVLYHTLSAVYYPMTSNCQNTPNTDEVY